MGSTLFQGLYVVIISETPEKTTITARCLLSFLCHGSEQGDICHPQSDGLILVLFNLVTVL
jgi:hypothetical protein